MQENQRASNERTHHPNSHKTKATAPTFNHLNMIEDLEEDASKEKTTFERRRHPSEKLKLGLHLEGLQR
jgi:hypothetical protein